ncbi:MAG TPA: phosphate ABC transporter substrate-binding/OmpA family protein [Candidatus Limnocylindrales bacterium]|nr:phosphate ABC transporter substrate-binding/OmpA family protein [Candidatus Limnocylindrales bacterium]
MAVKIEKGGWALIFLIGLALVGYSLYKYGWLDLGSLTGKGSSSGSSTGRVDTSKPLELPVSASDDNAEVRVRVNVWVGCVGGLVANGGLDTAPDSIFAKKGLKVSFKIIDDWTEGASALATNNVDVMLTTLDVYAKDYGQFQEKGFGSHAFLMVDWSRGADGVIGKQGINSIEDLAGKTVAFAPYTPSHFLLWNGLKASGLSTEQRNEIFKNAVHTKDGIEPAVLFAQEKVDAAVAWDPDMSDAVGKRAGAKKIYDTRVANRLIADILVVSDRFAAKHPQTLLKFSQGWLEGVEFIKNQPDRAYNMIGTIKDFNIPSDLAKTMLGGVKLADYADNLSFLGTKGANSDYANIFGMAQDMYRELRMIKRTSNPEDSVDRRYVQQLNNAGFSTASTEAPIEYKPVAKTATPLATQHRSIYFDPNSAHMSLDSRAVVDEIGGQMRAYENTVVDIEGNTDSTGARGYNMQLSRQRAEAVREYLMDKYGFPGARFRIAGNGPDRPLETNATPEGREKNRRTDIKLYANQ